MKSVFFTLFLFISFCGFSQNEISWDYTYNAKNKQLEMTAVLADGWHVYSTNLGTSGGPIQTEFEFNENQLVTLIEGVVEPKPKEEFDPNFDQMVKYFDHSVTFIQRVKVKKNTKIEGSVLYMVCNDTMCLPPVEEKFVINLKK